MPYRGAVPIASWTPPTRRRVRAVRDRLRAVYGIPRMAPHGDALAELVLTVLSQSTNDRNRDVAYLRLRARLATWEAVRDAPLAEVEEAIRPGGISKVKSRRIQSILTVISNDQLSLEWLHSVPLEQARDYLTSLPGVGRKTAACVLLFAYGLRDVPVDTHVSRVGMRLELLRAALHSRSCTTRCSRSLLPVRSSSCTSTSYVTAGAPVTRAVPPAANARWRECAQAAPSSRRLTAYARRPTS